MSSRLRTGIIIAAVGIVLAIVGVVALTGIFRRTLAPPAAPTPAPPLTAQVLITTHDVPIGSLLRESDLAEVEAPVEFVPRNALSNPDNAVGRITSVDLVAGEMLLEHNLADPTNINHDLAYTLEEDQVLLAFPATDLMSDLSIIQRGDVIDIFASKTQSVEVIRGGAEGYVEDTLTTMFTFDALQQVEITALVVEVIEQEEQTTFGDVGGGEQEPEAQPTPAPSQIQIRAYLLALSPQDALVLKHLKDAGAIFDFVIRSPTSTQRFQLDPVMEAYLNELYGLEILR